MNAKRKARIRTKETQIEITYKEADFYREKFAEWLTVQAGKKARGAFFALWALEVFSRVNISAFDREVKRARHTLQIFLGQTYKPDK